MAQATTGYRGKNSTADRTLTILMMFTETRLVLSATEVADSLGVARSTAYRYLQSLVQSEFLADDGRGGFYLGVRVLELARLARRGFGLSEIAVPVMRELAERFHHTVLLTRRLKDRVICLEREEAAAQYIRLSYERGQVLSLNAGASAYALLAWLDEAELRALFDGVELERFTATTLTDADSIVDRLRDVRAEGYAVSHGEVDPDAMGIAAPIFGGGQRVIAALSVVLIQSRTGESEIGEISTAVVEAAARISASTILLDGE
ncbi:IclR family transcriptional regulator [Microbacterium sp. 22242]|uniref:IclR family transcriptional regulator n=1 Tax=Microbacterium sp. 22242 TaxID=3453896 RepID=UPI003F838473